MTVKRDIDQAVYYLKLALPEMTKRSIPATPNNYAVWYEYIAGNNKALVKTINELTATTQDFDDITNQNLYNRFILNQQQAAVHALRQEVRNVIHNLLAQLSSEGGHLNTYAQSLESFAARMRESTEIEDIKALIAALLEDTRKREQSTLTLQASLDSMAQEITQLREEVERLNEEASTDALTRAANRRAFDINLDRAIVKARELGTPLCLVLVDIDHFKKFNDTFGHPIGDKVLRFVATALQKNVKGKDTVARYGGEEFAIILPETEITNAAKLAEQIRERIAVQRLSDSVENITLGTITVSIGLTRFLADDSAESFIRRADQCLYKAKNLGRNRVVSDPEAGDALPDNHLQL